MLEIVLVVELALRDYVEAVVIADAGGSPIGPHRGIPYLWFGLFRVTSARHAW
jgi:hypothetical protein